MRTLPDGQEVILQPGSTVYLEGAGASPKGDFPFLDRFDLSTRHVTRLFQSADKTYESFVALLNDDASRFVTRFETPDDPPNLFVREPAHRDVKTALTHFPDPALQLRGISKQLVTYKRNDGVQLSFTLSRRLVTRQENACPPSSERTRLSSTTRRPPGRFPARSHFTLIGGSQPVPSDTRLRDSRQRYHAGDRRSGNHE